MYTPNDFSPWKHFILGADVHKYLLTPTNKEKLEHKQYRIQTRQKKFFPGC